MKTKLILIMYPVVLALLALLFLVVYMILNYNEDLGVALGVAIVLLAVIQASAAITVTTIGE